MRFAILSDAHVISPGVAPQHGVDARVQLAKAVRALAGVRPAPSFVVHLGDLTSAPSPAAYAEFIRITRDVPMPQLYVQGNHDDGAMLAQALPLPGDVEPRGAPDGYYALVRCGVQVVVLNSNPVAGGIGGVSATSNSPGSIAPWPHVAVNRRCYSSTTIAIQSASIGWTASRSRTPMSYLASSSVTIACWVSFRVTCTGARALR